MSKSFNKARERIKFLEAALHECARIQAQEPEATAGTLTAFVAFKALAGEDWRDPSAVRAFAHPETET